MYVYYKIVMFATGGAGSYLWSCRFWPLDDCPSKEICQSFENLNEHAQSARKSHANYSRRCVLVGGDSTVENEFVGGYCLFAVSIFCDSTEFEHHNSLIFESVYTPVVYNVQNTSCDVRVNENNTPGVNSHLTWGLALSCSFRPSISIHFCFWDH